MLGHKMPRHVHTLLETRVALEALLHIGTLPLHRFLPRGDGHPVLVIPAFMATDGLTAGLRNSLSRLGYNSYPWDMGFNPGIRENYLNALTDRVETLAKRHQQPVSVIGWSLGGIYARALGNVAPERVRQVITLGSPFGIPTTELHGVQKGVARLYEILNRIEDPLLKRPELWQTTPEAPFTGVYTQTDGIIHWHYCIDRSGERCQNIRVPGTHVGLTHNPAALYVIADRLQQQVDDWKPFEITRWTRPLFRSACLREVEGVTLNGRALPV